MENEHYNTVRLQVDSGDPGLAGRNRSNTSYSVALPGSIPEVCALELSGWQIPGEFNPSFWPPNPSAGISGNDALDWRVEYKSAPDTLLFASGTTFFPNRAFTPEQLRVFIDTQLATDINAELQAGLGFTITIKAIADRGGRFVLDIYRFDGPSSALVDLVFCFASGPNAHRSVASTLGFRSQSHSSVESTIGSPVPAVDVRSNVVLGYRVLRSPATMALNRLGSLDVEVRPSDPLERPLERIYPSSFLGRYYDQTSAQGRRGGFFPRGSRVHLKTSDSNRVVRRLEIALTYGGRDPGDFAGGGSLPDHSLQFDIIYLNRTGDKPVPSYLDARLLA